MSNEEFEDLFGNTPFKNIEKIKEYINKNYIDKDKIRDKIEELNKELTNEITRNDGFAEYREYAIEVLEGLLESEE